MIRLNGRRGAFLLLFGAFHLIFGSSYLFPDPTVGVYRSLGFITSLGVPVWACGLPWVASGLVAWVAAFVCPPGRDGFGFQALVAIEFAWACEYFLSWLLADYGRGWVIGSAFAVIAGAVLIVSGMVSAAAVLRQREQS